MKPEEAKDALDYFKRRKEMYLDDLIQKRENVAIQALEKQVAKKPNVKELPDAFGRLYWNVCGACDEEIESDYDYCPECGQRIDRGEIE